MKKFVLLLSVFLLTSCTLVQKVEEDIKANILPLLEEQSEENIVEEEENIVKEEEKEIQKKEYVNPNEEENKDLLAKTITLEKKVNILDKLVENIPAVPSTQTAINTQPDVVQPEEDNTPKRQVQLYFHNYKKDPGLSCTQEYILPITREIPRSKTPITDTLKLLLSTEITAAEKEEGFYTLFGNKDFYIKQISLEEGIVKIDFPEVDGFTNTGACKSFILDQSIRKTALQFPEVKQVQYVKDIFQY